MALVGTFAAAGTNSLLLNYIPEYIDIALGTAVPSALRVSAQGMDTLVDLSSLSGFYSMSNRGRKYQNSQLRRRFQIADGEIPLMGSSCQFTLTLGAGTAATLSASSTRPGSVLKKIETVFVNENSAQVFDKFSWLGLPDMTTTDILNVLFANGHEESNMTREDLFDYINFNEAESSGSDYNQLIDNTLGLIKRVVFTPKGAGQNVFVQRWSSAKPGSISDLM